MSSSVPSSSNAPPPRSSQPRSRSGGVLTSHLESTITRLLVCTKSLLEGLAKWSRGEVNEEEISAIYVKLGNDFNVACAVFARENISMNELLSVPSDLRVCLETCLSETPSSAALERHLPQVRQIIIGLLHGLREKQKLYRDGVAARRAREAAERTNSTTSSNSVSSSTTANTTGPISIGPPLTPNSAGRSKEDLRRFVNQAQQVGGGSNVNNNNNNGGTLPASSSVPDNRQRYPTGDRRGASEESERNNRNSSSLGGGGGSIRSTLSSRGGSLRESSSRSSRQNLEGAFADANTGFFPVSSTPSSSSSSSSHPPLSSLPPLPRTASDASITSTASSARPLPQEPDCRISTSSQSAGSLRRRGSPPPPPRNDEPIPRTPTLDQFPLPFAPPVPNPSSSATAQPSIPTIVRPPSVSNDASSEQPQQQVLSAASLEALKASDNLSRRASKRYSAYAIQKMTSPGDAGERGGPGGSPHASPIARVSSSRSRTDLSKVANGGSSSSSSLNEPKRSKSMGNGDPYRSHRSYSSTSGGSSPHPPLPAIPRSFSSQQDLSARMRSSPIHEEDEFSPSPSPALSTSTSGPPSFPPPPLPRSASTTSLPPSLSSANTSMTLASSDDSNNNTTPQPPAQPFFEPLPNSTVSSTPSRPLSPPQPTYPFPIFLQIGRDVKKTLLASGPPTIESLRQLFVEKFSYNPGPSVSGWPEIYRRDEETGVSYELEDLEEVGPGSVLSLNIDTVEQVKQHIDQGLGSLAQDIKELRTHVFSMRRTSVSAAAHSFNNSNGALLSPGGDRPPSTIMMEGSLSPGGGGGPLRPSPSEAQFQDAAERVMRMKRLGSVASNVAPDEVGEQTESKEGEKEKKVEPKVEGSKIMETSSTTPIDTPTLDTPSTPSTPTTQSTNEIVSTLKSQHAEVQNLRREIGVLRQVYSDFTSQTKDMFSAVRVQTGQVRKLASTKKLSTDRAFVEAGTAKLESDSTNLVVKVDEVADTIEQLREDTVKGVRTRPQQLSELATQLRGLTQTRVKIVEWLKEVKPAWSQKWSEELSKILGEQKAVETQEKLMEELSVDLEEVTGILNMIQTVAKQQVKPSASGSSISSSGGGGGGGGRAGLRDISLLGGGGGGGGGSSSQDGLSTVLLEVKALQPDPAKRLEAIARAERQREQQLANKSDDFADELGEFVGRGKLKKSGGIEETERLRQARSEATLKAMFSG